MRKYLALLKLVPSIQDALTTSEGVAGTATLSKLADTFAPEDHEEALSLLRGLRQPLQLEILRASKGELSAIPRLKAPIAERDLDMRVMCSEGLCIKMPAEWKTRIKDRLSDNGQLHTFELQLPPLDGSTASTAN